MSREKSDENLVEIRSKLEESIQAHRELASELEKSKATTISCFFFSKARLLCCKEVFLIYERPS